MSQNYCRYYTVTDKFAKKTLIYQCLAQNTVT